VAKSRRKSATAVARARTYWGSLVGAMLLIGLLAFLVMVVLEHAALTEALADVRGHPDAPAPGTIYTLAAVIGTPVVAGIVAAGLMALLIPPARESLYLRRMHRFLDQYFATSGRMRPAGLVPHGVRFDPHGAALPGKPEPLIPMLRAARQMLLLGEPGSGKTFALYQLAHELTRRRRLATPAARRATLPVLVHLPAYADAMEREGTSFRHWVGRQLGTFGTPGLTARLPALVRRRRLLLLCDALDDVPRHLRGRVCEDLAALIVGKSGGHRVVLTCRLDVYTSDLHRSPALRAFDRIVISRFVPGAAERALQRARIGASRSPQKSTSFPETLRLHDLLESMELPAQLAELMTVATADDTMPFGRGALAQAFVRSACRTLSGAAVADSDASHLLEALASALRHAGRHSLPISSDDSPGDAIHGWLLEHAPAYPEETAARPFLLPPAPAWQALCDAAVTGGILRLSSDARSVGFDNAVMEAGFAAQWLATNDEPLGRASPDLLLPAWTLPVILWGTAGDLIAEVAQRVLRLADTPDTTAVRAGLTSPSEALPAALALALGVLAEGQARTLAKVAGSAQEQEAADTAQQHLRDLLDLAQAQSADPEQAELLARALRGVSARSGSEFVSSLGRLARNTVMGRLVRGEIIAVLGLIGSPAALAILVDLLGDTDPVVQLAVTQAFVAAGGRALDVLRAATGSAVERLRSRAGDIMAHFGHAAIQTALSALAAPDAGQRIAALRTLGQLGDPSVVDAVIARMDDHSADVRRAAAHTLGQLDAVGVAPGAAVALVRHREDGDPRVRAAVARMLGGHDDPEVQQALIHLLDDPDGQVRAAAATALGATASPEALHALEQHPQESDPLVRNALHQALERLLRR
jgi:HEAT repeat protein